jgi:hypothetical protein
MQRPGGRDNAANRRRLNRSGENASGHNARRNYERYLALARDATLKGDVVEAENFQQHAEHYFRIMNERA